MAKTSTKTLKKETDKALFFLAGRNPFRDKMEQSQYAMMLMEYIDHKGEDALQALAGFYIWCIANKKGKEFEYAVRGTFAHDLGEMSETTMLPRSTDYKQFWDEEMLKIN
jgi:hypothetical protein